MPISPNFSSVFEETHKVTFLNCQSNGYLKLTDLCNFFQLTAGTHAELGGISYADMQEHHQAWVLSRMRVEITQLPKWQDEVMVKTWIKSLENSRSIRCLEMYLNDEKIAGCETFWVVINTKTRRPENLASPHEHFEKYMIDAYGDTPIQLVGNAANNFSEVFKLLKGKSGIYVIINKDVSASTGAGYSGHVDAIINGRCITNSYITPRGGVKSIRIWILND